MRGLKARFFVRTQISSLMKRWGMDEKEQKFLTTLLGLLLDENIESRFSVIDLEERGQFGKMMSEIKERYMNQERIGTGLYWAESNSMTYNEYMQIISKVFK